MAGPITNLSDATSLESGNATASSASELNPVPPTLVQTIEAMLELARKHEAHERAISDQRRRLDAIEATVTGDTRFVSVIGYCKRHEIRLTNTEHAKVGMLLSKRCRERGIEVRRTASEHWGCINIYPTEMLDEWAAEVRRSAV